jgi:CheY-like chemotaxis protein
MHFLVVEDDDEARNLLVELLQESFPGSTVDQAITVAGALAEIQRCAKAGIVLDAAVLDFKLPLNLPGDNPETSEAACQMIRKTMGKTPFIVHISAFARTDSAIQDHLRCEHLNQGDTRVHFEEKFGEDAAVTPRRILKTLKAETYGPPIEQQLEAIFGRDFSLQQRSHRRSRPTAWRNDDPSRRQTVQKH